MKLLIAIPSRSRAALLDKCVLPWLLQCLPKLEYATFTVFIEPKQRSEYGKVVDSMHIIELPKNDMGNEFACDWIGHYALENKYDVVFIAWHCLHRVCRLWGARASPPCRLGTMWSTTSPAIPQRTHSGLFLMCSILARCHTPVL